MQRNEIDLREFLNIAINKLKIFLIVLVIMITLGITYLIYDHFMNYNCTMTVLVNGGNDSITKILENLNTDKVSGTFEKSTSTVEIVSKNTDEISAREGLEQYYSKLKEKSEELYKNISYSEVKDISFEEKGMNYYVRIIFVFIIVAIILYFIYIWIVFDMSVTTNKYELLNITNLKVLGNICNDESSSLINVNIELNKNLNNPKTILFVKADIKTDNSLVINNVLKGYLEKGYSVITVGYMDNTLTENISLENVSSKKEIEDILYNIKEKYDKILINSETMSADYKTNILANIADTSIIVARAKKTKIDSILMTKEYIDYVGGKISGIILG